MVRKSIIALVAAVLAASAAGAQPVEFTDAIGTAISMPGRAVRVVSLSPAFTEMLYAVGAGSAVVGVTSYCNYPAAALAVPKVGAYTADTISVETIVAMKPDLVIGEPEMHGSLAATFKRAGVRFAALSLRDFAAVYRAIELCAMAAGDRATAAALVASMKARVEAVRARFAGLPESSRPTVFWEIWDEPLMTAGPRTFTGQLIEAAGGRNIFADVTEDWPMVSFEAIVARDPQYIFSPYTHGSALTGEKLAARPGWAGIRAVRLGNVVLLDDDISSRPGPRFVEAIEAMAAALYPGR